MKKLIIFTSIITSVFCALGGLTNGVLEALKKDKVEYLKISYGFMFGKMTLEDAKKLALALRNNEKLKEFVLDNAVISDEVAEVLAEGFRKNTAMVGFALTYTSIIGVLIPISPEGLEKIMGALVGKVSSLEILKLENCWMGAAGAAKVAGALKASSLLRSLNLPLNGIGDTGAAEIREALMNPNSKLEVLDLAANDIGAAGVAKIVDALKVSISLRFLDLSYNKIGVVGAAKLGEALMNPDLKLEVLELVANDIGDIGAAKVADGLKVSKSLRFLNLSYNGIGAAGAAEIGEALKVNSTLGFLNLSYNRIGDTGAVNIGEALKVNTTLVNLGFGGNRIGPKGAANIGKALIVNTSLESLGLCSNRIQKKGLKG